MVSCHGFPESWYSWRHQLQALAEAGFRAVAPDMRGYGNTDRPADIDQYTLLHTTGDMVGLLDALGAQSAVIAGRDWGALVAWLAALLRPDRFRGVIALSVPYVPRGKVRPTTVMPQTADAVFYQLYFQTPGVAEAELERDVRQTIRRVLYGGSGDASRHLLGDPAWPASWCRGLVGCWRAGRTPSYFLLGSARAMSISTSDFTRTRFVGSLNWCRNIDRNWELPAPFAGPRATVSALYIAGDRDLVVSFPGMEQLISNLSTFVPELRGTIMLPECDHWTQQERAQEVNAAMIQFLRGL